MKSFKYILLAALAAFCCLIFIKIHLGKDNRTVVNAPTVNNLVPFPGSGLTSVVPPEVYGYLILRGDTSTASMEANLQYVNGVIVEALHVVGSETVLDNPAKQKPVFQYIREHNKSAKVIALVNNYSGGKWQVTKTTETLADPAQRTGVVKKIIAYVKDNKLDGVSLDFEGLREEAQENLVTFCSELHQALKENKLSLSINVEAGPDIDYAGLGKNVDQLILMDYDQHSVNTDPGPIASMLWFKQGIKEVVDLVDPAKVVIGLGAYAYDWEVGSGATGLTYGSAAKKALETGAKITFDQQTQNSTYTYIENGKEHVVWMLDRSSALSQKSAGQLYGINTFAVYRFGSEDQSLWKALK